MRRSTMSITSPENSKQYTSHDPLHDPATSIRRSSSSAFWLETGVHLLTHHYIWTLSTYQLHEAIGCHSECVYCWAIYFELYLWYIPCFVFWIIALSLVLLFAQRLTSACLWMILMPTIWNCCYWTLYYSFYDPHLCSPLPGYRQIASPHRYKHSGYWGSGSPGSSREIYGGTRAKNPSTDCTALTAHHCCYPYRHSSRQPTAHQLSDHCQAREVWWQSSALLWISAAVSTTLHLHGVWLMNIKEPVKLWSMPWSLCSVQNQLFWKDLCSHSIDWFSFCWQCNGSHHCGTPQNPPQAASVSHTPTYNRWRTHRDW